MEPLKNNVSEVRALALLSVIIIGTRYASAIARKSHLLSTTLSVVFYSTEKPTTLRGTILRVEDST